MLFLAADHAGFELKEKICHKLAERKIAFEDFGTFSSQPVDYPGLAKQLTKAVLKHDGKGVMFCGSGQGMAMTANRHRGARASVAWSSRVAVETREDNDANILSLPARFIGVETAWEIVSVFLSTSFSHADRHKRRIKQIDS
jgi:ribose 5-phosphate isomerase B